jgi:hypothetical protein
MENLKEFRDVRESEKEIPRYEPPRIITYTSEQILEQIGPAMACSGGPCGTEVP